MLIEELVERGVDADLVAQWKKAGYEQLLPVQEEALEKGILDNQSMLIMAPTSSGKTFVGEMAAVVHAMRGNRTLYLVPFKALAEEKYLDFCEKYATTAGLSIRISDRDHREDDGDIRIGNYDIAILTYEKLSALLAANAGILENCSCAIIDEVQMMSDAERGGNLELLLTKFKVTSSDTQLIALSAVLGRLNGLDQWLNVELIHRRERPKELREGVVLPTGEFHYLEWNSGQAGKEKFSKGDLFGLVRELVAAGEQVIIVRNSVRSAQQTAIDVAKTLMGLKAANSA